MNHHRRFVTIVGLTFLGLAIAIGTGARAQQMPRALTLATNPPGTVAYTLAAGFAKVISEATAVQMTVQPYTGTSTLLPLLNSGEPDFELLALNP